jgi:hypothetical protein
MHARTDTTVAPDLKVPSSIKQSVRSNPSLLSDLDIAIDIAIVIYAGSLSKAKILSTFPAIK